MRLDKKSLLIRWAYLPEIILSEKDKRFADIPTRTNLCDLIARILFAPFLFSITIVPIALVFFALIFPFVWVAEEFPKTRLFKTVKSRWKNSVIHAAIEDFKNKTCTMVDIVDEN